MNLIGKTSGFGNEPYFTLNFQDNIVHENKYEVVASEMDHCHVNIP